jgi:hypothetical protein
MDDCSPLPRLILGLEVQRESDSFVFFMIWVHLHEFPQFDLTFQIANSPSGCGGLSSRLDRLSGVQPIIFRFLFFNFALMEITENLIFFRSPFGAQLAVATFCSSWLCHSRRSLRSSGSTRGLAASFVTAADADDGAATVEDGSDCLFPTGKYDMADLQGDVRDGLRWAAVGDRQRWPPRRPHFAAAACNRSARAPRAVVDGALAAVETALGFADECWFEFGCLPLARPQPAHAGQPGADRPRSRFESNRSLLLELFLSKTLYRLQLSAKQGELDGAFLVIVVKSLQLIEAEGRGRGSPEPCV